MDWAVRVECPTATAKLVLMVLADHAAPNGSAFPSQKRLAQVCGISSRRTIQAALDTLESSDLIRRVRRVRSSGARSTDLVWLVGIADPKDLPAKTALRQRTKFAGNTNRSTTNQETKMLPGKGCKALNKKGLGVIEGGERPLLKLIRGGRA